MPKILNNLFRSGVMNRKKRELQQDLPSRSDPNYMKMYRERNKERLKELRKDWHTKKKEENPNYYKERYDPEKMAEYREKNKEVLSEKQWQKRGIINFSYKKYLEEVTYQDNKCKICNKEMKLPQVDHDHKTGEYRGLLCVPCNNGLGIYELNKEKYKKYLETRKNYE
jgi:hypothetical protein